MRAPETYRKLAGEYRTMAKMQGPEERDRMLRIAQHLDDVADLAEAHALTGQPVPAVD